MEKNNAVNREPNTPRPLSLEEAVAMAPPTATSPFIASTAAIAWGAVRSGQSVWEFLIGMTKEFEEKLQAGYEAWKAEHAWYPVGAKHADRVDVPATPAAIAPVTCAAHETDSTDLKEDLSTAILKASPIEAVTNVTEDATETAGPSDESSAVPADNETVREEKQEKKALRKPSADKAERSGEQANSQPPGELRAILEGLPKEPDPALYSTVLEGRDRDALIGAVKAMIEKRKRIHRPRTALLAFLNWLEGLA